MCNVSCVRRYCDCSPNTAALSVIIFRFMMLILLIVSPFCAICAVLDEFYQISGDITVGTHQWDIIDTNTNNNQVLDLADLINMEMETSSIPDFINLTVSVSAGWQHMTFEFNEDYSSFKDEYYAVSQSSVCDPNNGGVNCDKLDNAHNNGVRFLFACITGMIWSLLTLCIVSFHGATKRLQKSTITKVFSGCLCIGFIPVILMIIFQIMFSDNSAFCGMGDTFDLLIEEGLDVTVVDSTYHDCIFKNSDISQFPITWIPGLIMVLLLLLICIYKPLSPLVRRICQTCSCCVNRKVSDSVLHVGRYFSFGGSPSGSNRRFNPPKRRFSGSLN
mmetsp:Transcript_74088/g.66672  ORF Transcript_74088/g.66672 Transcript_74088/m.66672 type:complete len:332 (+) Transcript_74088:72-1067(+)